MRTRQRRQPAATSAAAGVWRSYAYAAATAARADERRGAGSRRTAEIARLWQELVSEAFRVAYEEGTRGTAAYIGNEATRHALLHLHLLRKALYEIEYEASHRPDWIDIPVAGVLDIIDQGSRT